MKKYRIGNGKFLFGAFFAVTRKRNARVLVYSSASAKEVEDFLADKFGCHPYNTKWVRDNYPAVAATPEPEPQPEFDLNEVQILNMPVKFWSVGQFDYSSVEVSGIGVIKFDFVNYKSSYVAYMGENAESVAKELGIKVRRGHLITKSRVAKGGMFNNTECYNSWEFDIVCDGKKQRFIIVGTHNIS